MTGKKPIATEPVYTVKEIALEWKFSEDTIYRMFRDQPGVLRWPPEQLKTSKRQYVTLRIPESVKQSVYEMLQTRKAG